jgi:hypothetical protein
MIRLGFKYLQALDQVSFGDDSLNHGMGIDESRSRLHFGNEFIRIGSIDTRVPILMIFCVKARKLDVTNQSNQLSSGVLLRFYVSF